MKIKINANSIKYFTGKAYLISIPKTDYAFWLSSKCCYENKKYATIYLNEEYTYLAVKKQGEKQQELSGKHIISHFDDYTVYIKTRPDVIVSEHIPESVDPEKEIKVDSSLLRGDEDD